MGLKLMGGSYYEKKYCYYNDYDNDCNWYNFNWCCNR